jgi:TRAP-type C4-dicarboxylate transport system permease small subunit
MRSSLARVVAAIDGFFRVLMLSVGAVVVLTVAIISWGVLARELLHLSDVWVTESTTYLMGYMTFVGGATLAWQGRHLKVDVLQHFLQPRAQRVFETLASVVVVLVALVLLWLAAAFWWDAWSSGEKSWGFLSLPLWIPYSSMLVGSALLAFAQVVRLVLGPDAAGATHAALPASPPSKAA